MTRPVACRGMRYLVAGDADAYVGDLLHSLRVKVSEGELTWRIKRTQEYRKGQ